MTRTQEAKPLPYLCVSLLASVAGLNSCLLKT